MNKQLFKSLFVVSTLAFSLFSCQNESLDAENIELAPSALNHELVMKSIYAESETISLSKNTTVGVTDRNPSTFANSLINAVRQAGNGGTVQLEAGNYYSDRTITLPAGIKTTIKGRGKFETKIFLTKNPGPTPGFININANGTAFTELLVDAQNKMQYGACAINTNGKSDIYLYNVGLVNASIGTGTSDNGKGLTPAGLTAIACSFYNCDHGINFNRQYSQTPAPWVKKVTISACWFGGTQAAGVSIDCGNDGIDGVVFRRGLPGAAEATVTVTNMDGMEIKNSTFEKASKYNIAIAKAWNIKIFNNTLKGNTGSILYGEAINLEHETHNIIIEDNKIYNEGLSNQNHSYISILTFRDYGNSPLLENGCRDITIRRNEFKGDCKSGIAGEYAQRITINNNTFSNPRPTIRGINFYVQSSNIWHWSNGVDNTASIVN
ncbi:right-handed parallel beta-helix repeat-containing protein [Aquimarina algiphila]|uniref:right-handed parallel beta-helix repeat-containing protein n=1 Tax=Aquimarina algiphila TaxID=2047982 RepID=UPI002491F8C8|nr:right-handed parallel beta-helix repeat-containing protein [Aquimarina algiphila]